MIDKNLLQDSWKAIAPVVKKLKPKCGVILGSGWGEAITRLEKKLEIPYDAIPGIGKTGVAGHKGILTFAQAGNNCVLIFQGRRHFYEGEGWTPIAIPVYLTLKSGATHLMLTNSAGGIRRDLPPGSLMIITDHINALPGHPLEGPHDNTWGPRFPDQSQIYDPALQDLLTATGSDLKTPLSRGVYLATSGPTYETPAEVRCYETWGADAVGMSTVPEAILGNAAGLRVAGLSCISNAAAGMGNHPLRHEDVTAMTQTALPHMKNLLKGFLESLR